MIKRWIKYHVLCIVLLLTGYVPGFFVQAQEVVSLEVEVSPVLENAQLINLASLNLSGDGTNQVLLSGYLENLTDQVQDNLFLEIIIRSNRSGPIVEITQSPNTPISLNPYQSVYATNNDLANGRIPGISQSISFTGGLTPAGEDLINNLEGSTSLPQDIYTVEVSVTQTSTTLEDELAESVAEIGGGIPFESSEIYLQSPGDVVGSSSEITNPYPYFSWQGEANASYRLIVVSDNGEGSPESLLQSAQSSAPVDEGGSLLAFENLDVVLDEDSYQFPTSGTQPLETGGRYYWRVSTTLETSEGQETRFSEIWSFVLKSGGGVSNAVTVNEDIEQALIALLGEEEYERLREGGFELEAIEFEGQQFSGQTAAIKLEEILRKIRDEDLIVGSN